MLKDTGEQVIFIQLDIIVWPQQNEAQKNHVHILWELFSNSSKGFRVDEYI